MRFNDRLFHGLGLPHAELKTVSLLRDQLIQSSADVVTMDTDDDEKLILEICLRLSDEDVSQVMGFKDRRRSFLFTHWMSPPLMKSRPGKRHHQHDGRDVTSTYYPEEISYLELFDAQMKVGNSLLAEDNEISFAAHWEELITRVERTPKIPKMC